MERRTGFTLMEILVALVIFSMLSVGAFGVLTNLRRSQLALEDHSRQLEDLQRVVRMTRHDLGDIIAHSLPSGSGDTGYVHLENTAISFTAPWPNPMGEDRSNLAAMRYEVASGMLMREIWPFAQTSRTQPVLKTIFADQITDIRLQEMDITPPSLAPAQSPTLPAAIEVNISMMPFGEIRQLIPMVSAP